MGCKYCGMEYSFVFGTQFHKKDCPIARRKQEVDKMITEIQDCDSLEDAFEHIREYFKTYNVAGYGTDAYLYTNSEGIKVKFTRLESCD